MCIMVIGLSIIGSFLMMMSLMVVSIIMFRPKSKYEQEIDDKEQLEFIEKYKAERLKKAQKN